MRRKLVVAWLMMPLLLTGLGTAFAQSSLADAVRKGDKAAVRAILLKHVDVNAAEPDGTTPLHLAAQANALATAALLLQPGANLKAWPRHGVPPLPLPGANDNDPSVERR